MFLKSVCIETISLATAGIPKSFFCLATMTAPLICCQLALVRALDSLSKSCLGPAPSTKECTMPTLILHHFDISPFSEKVRLVLGAKALAWQSVHVPPMLPKPDVVALTGGYRRSPFLQIGADIYCDSTLMCKVIDSVCPQPSLYPAEAQGLAEIVAQWADSSLFWTAIPFTRRPETVPHLFPQATPEFLAALFADRAAMAPNIHRPTLSDGAAQLHRYLERLENLLVDGRRFLLGPQPCIADFSVAQSIWFMRRSPLIAATLEPYARLVAWYEKVHAFGHGSPVEISSAEAVTVAASAIAHAPTRFEGNAAFCAGEVVSIVPTDYAQDPVTGKLVGLTNDEAVIERVDQRAGLVHVHFPRIGFQINAQAN